MDKRDSWTERTLRIFHELQGPDQQRISRPRSVLKSLVVVATIRAEHMDGHADRPGHRLRFLPLIARESAGEYDTWALRWLSRWAAETPATIEQAAEVAAHLADLPSEPTVLEALQRGARAM